MAAGSKSFAAAARLLPPAVRDDVARLYAWCRHADDVIDGQVLGHGQAVVADPSARLAELAARTDAALAGTITGEAVFDGFGRVARTRRIPPALAHDLLGGFAMDVAGARYETVDELAAYCYGVAGSVGVMMALTLGAAPADEDTLDRAADLGLAFQMTNIARDVVADAAVGRLYLPQALLRAERVEPSPAAMLAPDNAAGVLRAVERLLDEAERYYLSAEVGIRRLPFRSAWAIAAAAAVYRAIGTKRRAAGPQGLPLRVGTGRREKAVLLARSALVAARREHGPPPARAGLWQRPRRAVIA